MAQLIQCTGCGKEICGNSRKCTYCGEPVTTKIPFRTWLILILLLVVMYNIGNIDTGLSDTISATTSK